MNTPERNDKNIAKMQAIGRAYSDTEEDAVKEKQYQKALDEVTREYPLPTARRVSVVACIGLWVFSVGGLLFGVDLRGIFPFLFFALAVMVGFHLPIFWIKRKFADCVIGVLFMSGCIWLAVSLILR